MRLDITLILLVFLSSCNNKSKLESKKYKTAFTNKFSLIAMDTLEFDIDTLTNFQTKCLERVEIDSIEYLAYENRDKPSIQMYNLETKELTNEIFLKKNGPMGIGRIHGFHIHNLDSIFLINGSLLNAFLVNRQGEIIKKYDFKRLLPGISADPYAYSTKPIFYSADEKSLYIPCYGGKNPNKKGCWDANLSIKMNVSTEKTKYVFQGPKEYHEIIFGAFFGNYSIAQNEEKEFVYAFPFDSELIVTDYKGKYEKHYAGSKYFDRIPEKDKNTSHEQHYIESDSYAEMLYDQWRKVYYRVAERAVDMVDDQGNRNTWYDKIPSIIILDKDFNKIGETDLPKETYFIRTNIFVGKKGLYISNNHIKNPNADENKLSFTLFALEEL